MDIFNKKKQLQYLLVKLVFCLLLLGGCHKNEINQSIEFKAVEHLNECDIDIIDGENSDIYLIINSEEELTQQILFNDEEQIPCIQLRKEVNVDFSKWTLLIGKKRLVNIEGELIEQEVVSIGDDLIYKLTIKKGGYTAIGQFRFGVFIPKISKSTKVDFDVTVE